MPRPTPEELDHDQTRRACQLFYDTLPMDAQVLFDSMCADYGMSVVQLVAAVWADRLAEWMAMKGEELT